MKKREVITLFKKESLHGCIVPALLFVFVYNPNSANALPITGTIDINTTYQTMDGFGGSIAWYNNWLHSSAQNAEIYDSLSINWSGVVSGSAMGTTGSDGKEQFYSANTKSSGALTFTVVNLSKGGYTYSPSQNKVTSKSIEL